jgi:hypothetical protein
MSESAYQIVDFIQGAKAKDYWTVQAAEWQFFLLGRTIDRGTRCLAIWLYLRLLSFF